MNLSSRDLDRPLTANQHATLSPRPFRLRASGRNKFHPSIHPSTLSPLVVCWERANGETRDFRYGIADTGGKEWEVSARHKRWMVELKARAGISIISEAFGPSSSRAVRARYIHCNGCSEQMFLRNKTSSGN
jgi:hypothetical protein